MRETISGYTATERESSKWFGSEDEPCKHHPPWSMTCTFAAWVSHSRPDTRASMKDENEEEGVDGVPGASNVGGGVDSGARESDGSGVESSRSNDVVDVEVVGVNVNVEVMISAMNATMTNNAYFLLSPT